MEALVIITVIYVVLALFSRESQPTPPPQIIILQGELPSSGNGLGCLILGIIGLLLLLAFGTVQL